MSVLAGFSLEDLEEEVIRRKADLLKTKISAVYDALQEAENIARGNGEYFELEFGSSITILFNPETDDWELN